MLDFIDKFLNKTFKTNYRYIEKITFEFESGVAKTIHAQGGSVAVRVKLPSNPGEYFILMSANKF